MLDVRDVVNWAFIEKRLLKNKFDLAYVLIDKLQ